LTEIAADCSWLWEPFGVVARIALHCDNDSERAVSGPTSTVAIEASRTLYRLGLRFQFAEHPFTDFGIVVGDVRHDASEPFFERRTHPSRRRKSISPA